MDRFRQIHERISLAEGDLLLKAFAALLRDLLPGDLLPGEDEIVGVHTITFGLNGEEFDLVHRAVDRSIYAKGAIEAGKWLVAQPAGRYSASDWLSGSLG